MICEKRQLEREEEPFKYRKEDPLSPLYNPSSVHELILESTANAIFQHLRTLPFIHHYENLYETALLALRSWKPLLEPKKSLIHQLFIEILITAERFSNAPRDLIHLQLADESTIAITVQQMDTLTFFSDTLEKLWTDNWKEKKTQQLALKHPAIDEEVFSCIVHLLFNAEYQIPKNLSILRILSAVDFLQIPHLSVHLLNMLLEHVRAHYMDIESILTIFDYTLYYLPNKKELIDNCFDSIHHYISCREKCELPDAFSLQTPELKEIEPGLKALLAIRYKKSIDYFNSLPDLTKNWTALFRSIALNANQTSEVTGEASQDCTDYRWCVVYAQRYEKKCPEQAKPFVEKVIKLKPNHLFISGIKGVVFRNDKQSRIAFEALEAQINATSNPSHWRFKLAKVHRIHKENNAAFKIYDQILANDPNSSRALKMKVLLLYQDYQFDEAIKVANRGILLNGHLARIYELKIYCFMYQLKYMEALDCADKALEATSNATLVVIAKLSLLLQLKRLDKIPPLIQLLPTAQGAYFEAWKSLLERDFAKADKFLSELPAPPIMSNLDCKLLQAYQYVLQGKTEEYNAIDLKENNIFSLKKYITGLSSLLSNENTKVVEMFKGKVKSINIMELKACALYNLKNKESAKKTVQKILSIDPNYPMYHKLLGLLHPKEKKKALPVII